MGLCLLPLNKFYPSVQLLKANTLTLCCMQSIEFLSMNFDSMVYSWICVKDFVVMG
jgi:hypothetical protein